MTNTSSFILPDTLHRKGCSMLAVGIVRQAIKDWQDAVSYLEKNPGERGVQDQLDDTERFFLSDWYQELRELAPDVIPVNMMEALRR
ncbi:MAG: hypothetical protein J5800_09835 [Spirochaetales bacterium]|nr:hypothetical protein [Spirochaetales bacterium]